MMDTESILHDMLLIRRTEEEIVARYGKQQMRAPVHLSIGQEAIAVGACHHLKATDVVFSTHRCHAHYLAKGGSLKRMTLELHGKVGGCADGRVGSMHLFDKSVNIMSIPIVASAIPLAVGAALANKMDGNGNIVVCFFGDAAVEEGVFHESLNFASLMQLPIIFVCENNHYSVDTHIDKRQPVRVLSNSAMAHDMESFHLNGSNPFMVAKSFELIIKEARQNKPTFVVISGYRKYEHCGIALEKHPVEGKDPLKVTIEAVLNGESMTQVEIDRMDKEVMEQIKLAFDAAEIAALPTPEMAKEYVYA